MVKTHDKDIVASLLDLPEFTPETAEVELPRLGIVLELRELSYDKLTSISREQDPNIHLILASVVNHPELRQEAWYHDKMGCATPVDALKRLLRRGEVTKVARVIDLLNGYGANSVVPLEREQAAAEAAVEYLEKN